MKILTTAVLLIITLLVVPIFSYFFGTPPDTAEWNTLNTLVVIMSFFILYSFIAGELTGNYSQVDKLWSVLPVVYLWVIAANSGFNPRLTLMSILVTIWGTRLTANFAMKGAYSWKFWAGEEDYRWQVLRAKPEFNASWKWTLFNLFFISAYQNVLILLFTLPALVAMQQADAPIGPADIMVSALMLFFIIIETVADLQQWKFQNRKHSIIRKGEPLSAEFQKGFLDKGLWAYSRHPNYFAEQAIWVCFYLFSISAGAQWLNWSIAGCLLLIVLFQGSSSFSEEISSGKYPEYATYQKKVGKFLSFRKM